jgi:hypothetical protein
MDKDTNTKTHTHTHTYTYEKKKPYRKGMLTLISKVILAA